MIVHQVVIGKQKTDQIATREHKKIYVGCAESDIRYRDMLVYSRHRWELYAVPTIDFLTLDRKGTEMYQWKPIVKKVILRSNGVMIVVSPDTATDCFVNWEIDCAVLNNVPIVGGDISKYPGGKIPDKLVGKMTRYGWEWFAKFINGL